MYLGLGHMGQTGQQRGSVARYQVSVPGLEPGSWTGLAQQVQDTEGKVDLGSAWTAGEKKGRWVKQSLKPLDTKLKYVGFEVYEVLSKWAL